MNNEENINIETIKKASEEPLIIKENKDEKPLYPMEKGMKFIFYLLSFFIFPGIVFGAVFYSKNNPEYRKVGKNCIYIALLPLIFYLIIIIFFSGQFGDVFGDNIKDVPY